MQSVPASPVAAPIQTKRGLLPDPADHLFGRASGGAPSGLISAARSAAVWLRSLRPHGVASRRPALKAHDPRPRGAAGSRVRAPCRAARAAAGRRQSREAARKPAPAPAGRTPPPRPDSLTLSAPSQRQRPLWPENAIRAGRHGAKSQRPPAEPQRATRVISAGLSGGERHAPLSARANGAKAGSTGANP